jgi:hypothetical protein
MRNLSIAVVVIGVLVAGLFGAGGWAAAEEREEIKINGNKVSRAASCRGKSMLIDGNENRVQLSGQCNRVHINGNGNTVVLNAVVSVVSVNGNQNQVYFSASRTNRAMTLFTSLGLSADCRGLTQVPIYQVRTGHTRWATFSVSQRGFSLGWGLQGKVARTPHQSKGSGGTVCPATQLCPA